MRQRHIIQLNGFDENDSLEKIRSQIDDAGIDETQWDIGRITGDNCGMFWGYIVDCSTKEIKKEIEEILVY